MKLDFVQNASKALKKNSPVILTGVGCAGLIATVVLAVKATPKAEILLEKAWVEKYPEGQGREKDICRSKLINELGMKDAVITTWKCYIPATVVGIGSVACFLMAHKIDTGKSAAMASAYSLLERTMDEYQDRVIKEIGKDKNDDIRREVQEKIITISPSEEMIVYGKGDILCFESLTGRFFRSDEESIREAANEFNHNLIQDYASTMNDWFICLDLPSTPIGDSLEWTSERLMEIDIRTVKAPNGLPALAIDYLNLPRYYHAL